MSNIMAFPSHGSRLDAALRSHEGGGPMKLGILYIAPFRCWKQPCLQARFWGAFYRFGNLPHIKPGRWGWGFCGLIEIGNRTPGGRFGVWLGRVGLWRH